MSHLETQSIYPESYKLKKNAHILILHIINILNHNIKINYEFTCNYEHILIINLIYININGAYLFYHNLCKYMI